MSLRGARKSFAARTASFLLLAAVVAAARADVVRLRDGTTLQGEVVSDTATIVVVKTADGTVALDRGLVAGIDFEPRTSSKNLELSKRGEHYLIAGHGIDEEVMEATSAAAEAAWAAVASLLPDMAPSPHERPLTIHVYRRFEAFTAADAAYGGAKYAKDRRNFASSRTMSAYLLFEVDEAVVKKVGVSWEFRRSVAHEAAHLAVYERFRQASTGVDWLDEGLAMYVEDLTLARLGWSQGVSAEPGSSTYMATCLRLRGEGRLPEPRAVFDQKTALDENDLWNKYAVYWALARFLFEPTRRERTLEMIAKARELSGGDDLPKRIAAIARETWSEDGLGRLGDRFREYVDGFSPEWEIWYGSFYVDAGRWIASAKDNGLVEAWRATPAGRTSYSIRGSVAVEPLEKGKGSACILLGRTKDDGCVDVTFNPESGVSINEWRTEQKGWTTLARQRECKVAPGTDTTFEVDVAAGEVVVKMDSKEVLRAPVKAHDMAGAWGVGASGSAGVFKHVEFQ